MKLGITFPHNIAADGEAITDFAGQVEGAGFAYLCGLDHVLGAHPDAFRGEPYVYTYESPTHELLVLFSYLAAVTDRLEFATTALVLAQRQAVLVAKQAAQLQLLSGGRLRLGVVVGWNRPESEGMGADFHQRGKRLDEQVQVLRALWRQPLVEWRGRFHHLDRVGINPLPSVPPALWIGGGYEDRMLRRVARYADGWLPSLAAGADFAGALQRLRQLLVSEGRDPGSIGIEVRLNLSRVPRDQWVSHVKAYRDLGASHLAILPVASASAKEQLAMALEAKAVLEGEGLVQSR